MEISGGWGDLGRANEVSPSLEKHATYHQREDKNSIIDTPSLKNEQRSSKRKVDNRHPMFDKSRGLIFPESGKSIFDTPRLKQRLASKEKTRNQQSTHRVKITRANFKEKTKTGRDQAAMSSAQAGPNRVGVI